jgi:hypothetical protein
MLASTGTTLGLVIGSAIEENLFSMKNWIQNAEKLYVFRTK